MMKYEPINSPIHQHPSTMNTPLDKPHPHGSTTLSMPLIRLHIGFSRFCRPGGLNGGLNGSLHGCLHGCLLRIVTGS